jgi:hypothetical protein
VSLVPRTRKEVQIRYPVKDQPGKADKGEKGFPWTAEFGLKHDPEREMGIRTGSGGNRALKVPSALSSWLSRS